MSGSSSAQQKKKLTAEDFIRSHQKQTTKTTSNEKTSGSLETGAFANIEQNPFYKVILSETMSPEDKKNEVAKILTFHGDKELSKTRLEEFNQFKGFLQFERKRMAQEIIALTDTEAFSELKQVFEDINTSLLNFENSISPLTDIVDAVYTLRMNGVTFDVFREILEEKEEQKRKEEEKIEKEKQLKEYEQQIKDILAQNQKLKKKKILFLGPITQSAKDEIAQNNEILKAKKEDLNKLVQDIEALNKASEAETEFADFAQEKEKLRELLDISSEEHKARQEMLVTSAQNFITTTEQRVSSVLNHFDGMNDQIGNLDDANYSMRSIYAILNDATKDANQENEYYRQRLIDQSESLDSELARISSEREQRDLEGHISSLGRSTVDTTSVLAELTASGHRILSMKEANEQQVAKTRQLHTSGVAGVADQLSTVLQAVSAAALGESSETARTSLERMNKTTQELTQKEVIRVALGTQEVNETLAKAFDDLTQYGEVIKAATNITREGLSETKDLLSKIERQAEETQQAVKDSLSVAADVTAGKGGTRQGGNHSSEDQKDDSGAARPNPFKI